MTDTLVVAAAQMQSVFGDVEANVATMVAMIQEAAEHDVRLIVFPELSTVGYDLAQLVDERLWLTPEDARLVPIAQACTETGMSAVVGAAWHDPASDGAPRLAVFVMHPDRTVDIVAKMHIPGDEARWFREAPYPPCPILIDGWRVVCAVCFDAANPSHAIAARAAGADCYVASAIYDIAEERRLDLHFGSRAMDHRMVTLLANCTGSGNDWESCGLSGTWGPDGERRTIAAEPTPVHRLVIDRIERALITRYRDPAQFSQPR